MTHQKRALLDAFDQAYSRRSWHGTNLRGAIRGLTPADAAWRPAPGRHNVWELVVHCAYWKYAVWRRLTGAKRGSFPLEGSHFFTRPVERSTAAWRADVALLERMHRQLRAAIEAMPAAALAKGNQGRVFTNADLVAGITAHDLYHAGQMQLIKVLRRAARRAPTAGGAGARAGRPRSRSSSSSRTRAARSSPSSRS